MADEPSPLSQLRALAREIPEESRIRGLLRVIENRNLGSDYAVAIIGAALIERALEAGILSRLVPLSKDDRNRLFSFENKGPLADLGIRSRMGMALGLYGAATFSDLEKIRHVRNLFAHSPALRKFGDKAVANACSQFNVLDHVFRDVTEPAGFKETPQQSYVSACLQISGRLRGRLEQGADQTALTFPMTDGLLP